MNQTKLMVLSFCTVAFVATTVFAEEDFGIESASPVTIANPVNPQPGMVLSGYRKGNRRSDGSYSVRVNGKPVIASGGGQTSADVVLNAGWNKIDLVCQFPGNGKGSLSVAYKPKESLSDARQLTPAMLFHDQKPEEDW